MKKKAFTLVETMISIILMVLVLTALWQVFSSTQKNAKEVLENHSINDELDRTLIRIMDDVREANYIASDSPPMYEQSEIEGLKTTKDAKNQLIFTKVDYHFDKDPSTLGENEKNYTAVQVIYRVEKEDEPNPTPDSKWVLIREQTPFDENSETIEAKRTVYTLLHGIDECLFYRIKDPEAVRSGNIYIKLQVGKKDKEKYKNESIISVKERGAMPES